MSFWDIPDATIIRDASTRIVLGPIRQNLMLLMGKYGTENYSRAATIQELVELGLLNVDRGSLYASSGGAGGGGGNQNAAQAAADRAQTSATNAAGSSSSAGASAASAAESASLASTAADQAQGFSDLASGSATAAAGSASAAATSATNASNSASSASTSATNASNSATLASDWASKDEDQVVSGGKYSALHYAAKAEDSAIAAAASAQDAEDALFLEENAAQTDDYTLALTDQSKVVVMNVSTSGKTITVPLNSAVAFPVGSVVHLYNRSSDDVAVAGDSGVTVRNAGNISQYVEARLRKRATNEWVLTIF
jgi:hypothetical protein